jgi:hypothetical protein
VVAQEHHVRAADHAGQAFALGVVQGQAVVGRIHRRAAMKAHRVLGQVVSSPRAWVSVSAVA